MFFYLLPFLFKKPVFQNNVKIFNNSTNSDYTLEEKCEIYNINIDFDKTINNCSLT